MVIKDLFSKRDRKAEPAPLIRDAIPQEFRVQVLHIWARALGTSELRTLNTVPDYWKGLHDNLAEEHGLMQLGEYHDTPRVACQRYLLGVKDAEKALDLIQLSFRIVERVIPQISYHMKPSLGIFQDAPAAIADLNHRFDEHNLAYQYSGGHIFRRDSAFLHSEVAEPALRLLHAENFEGPEEEFRSAHNHFRHGRMKEATTEALKAFESTMKAICAARGWGHKPTATAKDLIAIMLKNKLIPEYLDSELGALRSLLESALPTVRNRDGGHGQGAERKPMPQHLGAFALHSAATNIVLLMQAHGALK